MPTTLNSLILSLEDSAHYLRAIRDGRAAFEVREQAGARLEIVEEQLAWARELDEAEHRCEPGNSAGAIIRETVRQAIHGEVRA